MNVDQTILIMGILGIILGLMSGFLICKVHFMNRAFNSITHEAKKQNRVFKAMLKIMARDGLDVKSYLDKAAETEETENNNKK